MRTAVVALVALATLAGCLEAEPEDDCPATGSEITLTADGCVDDGSMEPTLSAPDDFTAEGTFLVGHDPYNFVTGEPCSQPQSSCEFVAFTTEVATRAGAVLSWDNPANDLDLYLFTANGDEVSRDGINNFGDVPTTSHNMPATSIPPGDYEYYVVAWNAAASPWVLDVSFS